MCWSKESISLHEIQLCIDEGLNVVCRIENNTYTNSGEYRIKKKTKIDEKIDEKDQD